MFLCIIFLIQCCPLTLSSTKIYDVRFYLKKHITSQKVYTEYSTGHFWWPTTCFSSWQTPRGRTSGSSSTYTDTPGDATICFGVMTILQQNQQDLPAGANLRLFKINYCRAKIGYMKTYLKNHRYVQWVRLQTRA